MDTPGNSPLLARKITSSPDVTKAMPIGRRLRHLLAAAVWYTRPSLFYYVADKAARRGVRVREMGDAIDIVRPADLQIIRIAKANALYLPLVTESFSYFFGSARPVRIRTRQGLHDLVDFSTPRLHQINGFDDFPVLCPSLTEPFITTEQYLQFAQLSEGQVALDLGAYSALSSIAFSKAVGRAGKVVALEPDPLNVFAAEANIAEHRRVNGLDNIVLLTAAAAAEGPRRLQFSSEGAMGSALTSITGRHRGDAVEVKAVTLQDVADKINLKRVDFIKVDIEGSEVPVLLGSEKFLRHFRPRLIIEPHFIDGKLTADAVISFLTSIGFHCKVITQTGLLSLPLITAEFL